MNRVRATRWMLLITAAAVLLMQLIPWAVRCGRPTEREARVTLCSVTLGNVERITAASGVLRGRGEYAAMSPAAGVVSAVYVSAGDRVKAGQALYRMNGEAQERAVTAALSRQETGETLDVFQQDLAAGWRQAMELERGAAVQQAGEAMESLTVRAQSDGIVRAVNVAKNGVAAAGMPGVMLSEESQEIQCAMVEKDAADIAPGMSARILWNGQVQTRGVVTDIGTVTAVAGQSVCPVTVTPEEPLELPMGAKVEVEIIRERAYQVPVLPVEAVSERDTVRWVADGRCYEMPVTVLMADETCCWVDMPRDTAVVLSGEDTVAGQRVREAAP